MESTPATEDSLYIFGSDRGRRWDASQWTSVDDRVRGGKSVSQLDVSDPKDCATFRGNLDIKTLGGAGFASQKTISELFADGLDLSSYDTLVVDVHRPASDDKTYTLILKDTESLPKRPDGREQSTVSWEHDFRLGSSSNGGHLAMHFGDFKPTYRGRPKPDTEPLNLQNILSMSIMMRSHFGEQEGDFSLTMRSIAAQRHGSTSLGSTEDATSPQSLGPQQNGDITDKGQATTAASKSWLSWPGSLLWG